MKKSFLIALITILCLSTVKAQTQKDTTNSDWHYYTRTDEMTGDKSNFADIYSEPSSNYNLTANLIIRNSKAGNEILLAIPNGVIDVGINGIVVSVKFDDGKVEKFSAHSGDTNKFSVLFLGSVSKFLKELKVSKKMLLQISLYDKGDEVFHLSTEGLIWNYK
jgi:hypothetical protein